ncbi:MAG: hypothetical protein JJ902_09250 [Roseibium sp.]|nr:hypothetical protein [Roseibium sp.]
MSKYDPLREHLARLDDVVWAAKLDDVEEILGSGLPRSAREHRTWWANSGGSLVHQNAWLDAGWRVERTDLMRNVVVFRRLRIGGTALAQSGGRAGRRDPGSEKEKQLAKTMSSLRQPVTVTLRAEWTVLGNIHKVPCSATVVPATAGIVRIASIMGDETQTAILPVESIKALYRRIRAAMMADGAAKDADGSVLDRCGFSPDAPLECDLVKPGNAWVLTDGRGRKADLTDPDERRLVAKLLHVQEVQGGRESRLVEP